MATAETFWRQVRVCESLLHYVAGVLLILVWVLYFLLLHDSVVAFLVNVGWVILVFWLVLIFLPMLVLRRKGKPEEEKDFTHTTAIVDTGIYGCPASALSWLVANVCCSHPL